ncbi:MAG: hypothetical protein Q9196_004761 [Gyalolechia fulgens]
MENLNTLMDALPAPLLPPSTNTQRVPRNRVRRGPLSRPTTLQHRRNQQRRREDMPNVNTIVPRAASVEFRHQRCRRELWMAKAQAKQAKPRVKPHMRRLVAQQQPAEHNRLAAWEKHVREDQGTTRLAGHSWAVQCFNTDNWGPYSAPSRDDFRSLLAHFRSSLKHPRNKMSPKALQLLKYYDTLPLQPNSTELAKARIRMVREMMLLGVLEQEKAKGLQVSAREERKAELGLIPNGQGGWMMLDIPERAIFWREKDIEWDGVQSWVGISGYELPLRSAHDKFEQLKDTEVAIPVIEGPDDDDEGSDEGDVDNGEFSDDEEDYDEEGDYDSEGLYEDDVEPIEEEDVEMG